MTLPRRQLLAKIGTVAAASTLSAIGSGCGTAVAEAPGCTAASSLNAGADLTAMSKFYGNGKIDYISTRQGGGTNYATRVYNNPVTVGEAVAAMGMTTQPVAVIRGFYLDPADTGHTPIVAVKKTATGIELALSLNHGVQTIADKDGAHGITAVDVWIAGGTTPIATQPFTAAAAGTAAAPVATSIPLTTAQLGGKAHVYVITHCNNHGGRAQLVTVPA